VNYKRYDTLSNEHALFLLLCRLRHVVGLADLAITFCLSTQWSVVINTILDIMDFKFGQLPLWPYRDSILSQIPACCFQTGFSLIFSHNRWYRVKIPGIKCIRASESVI